MGEWNMTLCQGKLARFYLWPKPETPGDIFVTKETDSTELQDEIRLVGYTVSPTSHYIVNFLKLPRNEDGNRKTTNIRFTGMDGGMKFRLGICIPTGLTRSDISVPSWLSMAGKRSSWRDIKDGVEGVNGVIEADSLEDLDSDDTKNVFYDREKSILYVKAVENDERNMETDLADCVGSLSVDNSCPVIMISFKRIQKEFPDLEIDLNDAICTER